MRRYTMWICTSVWILAVPVHAEGVNAALQTQANNNRLLISTSNLSPGLVLPPPPAPETQKNKDEVLEVKRTAAAATPAQRSKAASDAGTQNVMLFADTVKGFDINQLPQTKRLFEQVRYTEAYEAKAFKNYFIRLRPYAVDSDIMPCTATPEDWRNTSYPSGHTVTAFTAGVILANLIPEQASAIMERAKQYAENRMICGVHHRSDITGGQVLGTLVATLLLENAEFQQKMDAAKQELRAAGLTR